MEYFNIVISILSIAIIFMVIICLPVMFKLAKAIGRSLKNSLDEEEEFNK